MLSARTLFSPPHPFLLPLPSARRRGPSVFFLGDMHPSEFSDLAFAGTPVVVKVCTNLTDGSWVFLQSTNLAGGLVHFSDGDWTNFPARYYIIGIP